MNYDLGNKAKDPTASCGLPVLIIMGSLRCSWNQEKNGRCQIYGPICSARGWDITLAAKDGIIPVVGQMNQPIFFIKKG